MLEFFLYLAILIIGSIIFYYLLNILFFKKRKVYEKGENLENLKIEEIEEKKGEVEPSFYKKEKITINDLINDFLQKSKDNENYLLEKRIKEIIKKTEDLFKEIEEYEKSKSKQN